MCKNGLKSGPGGKIMNKILSIVLACPVLLVAAPNKEIKVELKDAQAKDLGTATLVQYKKGVKISLNLKGLTPGAHAIHIHENGICEGPAFTTAGGHLNPEKKEHGMENPKGHHAGDMPNIIADKDGVVKTSFVNEGVTLLDGPNSLKKEGGAALIIHAGADDYKTNPSGGAGDRVACGIVEVK